MKEVKLNQTYYKVLITIKALNDLHYYPLNAVLMVSTSLLFYLPVYTQEQSRMAADVRRNSFFDGR